MKPAAKSISREEVKQLAINIGVRPAAKQLGIPENTVLSWSKRGNWFSDPPKPPSVHKQNGTAISAIVTPSDALRNVLEEQNSQTKVGLSTAVAKASKVFGRGTGAMAIRRSEDLHRIVKSASAIHGWEAGNTQAGPIQFNVLAQRAYFQTGQSSSEG